MATNESGGAGNGQAAGQQCNLLQLFIKDASFEAPGVPGILFGHEQPELHFDVSNTYELCTEATAKLGEVYAVLVRVTVQAKAGDKTLFLIEVQQGGLFEVRGCDDPEGKDRILRVKGAEALYPYARELVSSLVSRAGFPRLQLAAVNFESRYTKAMQEYHDAVASGALKA
jgi:preprotein translocase subunit SecB